MPQADGGSSDAILDAEGGLAGESGMVDVQNSLADAGE
jgi:hypothetical protein